MRCLYHSLVLLIVYAFLGAAPAQRTSIAPGTRSVMDAHNCYPYFEWWSNRIDRALSAGTPLAIEQDLSWYTDPRSGKSWSVVAHGGQLTGQEPTMEQYFFERVRTTVEKALRSGDYNDWPLITLNLDFKSEEPEHLAAVRSLLEKYRDWLTTAPRTSDGSGPQPLDVKPILVLTGESDAQQRAFYDHVPVGGRLLVFGAVHSFNKDPIAPPDILEPEKASNYRRWWNNPWKVVERGGQNEAGEWTDNDDKRLRSLVGHAHSNGLWIRFYTLDGATEEQLSCFGWFRTYNFGSLDAVRRRWSAAAAAGVDYIASDQYEELERLLRSVP